MKIWHDDIRTPPDDSWEWCRTNEAAIAVLEAQDVDEISLDHDLGLHDLDPSAIASPDILRGTGEATGLDLVDWMCFNNRVPLKVTIHSWNTPGAMRMFRTFCAKGYLHAIIRPFDLALRVP